MGSESVNQREVLDNKIKQNLHDEVEMTETFEYKGISIPVELMETRRGNKYVAVDYKAWNSVTINYTDEQWDEISTALHEWFVQNDIFVDRWHSIQINNKNAPIYWLLDDSDDE